MNSKIRIGRIKDVSNGKITYTDPFLSNITHCTSILNIVQRLDKGFVNNNFYFIDIVNKSILIKIGNNGYGNDIKNIKLLINEYEQDCTFIFISYYSRIVVSNCKTLIGNGYVKEFTKPIFGVYEHIPLNTGEIGYLISHTDGTLLFVLW